MNREYQKFGRENFESGSRSLRANHADSLPAAFQSLWNAYENFLDGMPSLVGTVRDRNIAFEHFVRERGLLATFLGGALRLPEAGLLADLQPRMFRASRASNRQAYE